MTATAPLPYTAPTYELHHGDMLEVMPTLAAGSVQMCFADLPYGIVGHAWDSGLDLDAFWTATKKILSVPANVVATAINPFAAKLIEANIKMFRYDMVWEKNSASGFLQAKTRPLRAHELLLIFSNPKAVYRPQMIDGKVYSHKSVTRGRKTYQTQNYTNNITPTTLRHPRSVVRYGVARYTDGCLHPTQKPVALLEWLIATYTNPGDTVLDPCFGSNTTGVACARLGRNYIGIEKDAAYFAAGKVRLEDEHVRLASASGAKATTSPPASPAGNTLLPLRL